MKLNYLSICVLLVLGLFLFTSCEKENIDETTIEEEEVTLEVVVCDLEVLIAEQPPGTGALFTALSGGTAPYTYLWSTGETTSNVIVIEDGTYSVIVTDAEGCTSETEITISLTDPCQFLTTDIEENPTGTMTANTSGGTTPYTYLWSTGETTSSISVTVGGTYSVIVTDTNGCIVEKEITVTGSDPCLSLTGEVEENPAGTLIANISGGTAPYTYLWSTGETTSSVSVAVGGTYSVMVIDAIGCNLEIEVVAIGPDPCVSLTVAIAEQPPGSGALFTAVTGGTAPFAYTWSTGETTSNITVTTGGTYTVSVTDNVGCVSKKTIDL